MSIFELSQKQALLLRAVDLEAEVGVEDVPGLRRLFTKLKFLRLLFSIDKTEKGTYRIKVDGPASLFTSSTRYGLQLALSLPAIMACPTWKIEANIQRKKEAQTLRFCIKNAPQKKDNSQITQVLGSSGLDAKAVQCPKRYALMSGSRMPQPKQAIASFRQSGDFRLTGHRVVHSRPTL